MKKNILYLLSLLLITFNSYAQWTSIGNGFDGDVNAVCVFNNSLYAAGAFTHEGGSPNPLSHIARWNGSTWVSVGSGLDANVTCMAVFNSELYVGGDFQAAGTTTALRIAKWNGTTWSAVGSGFDNTVRCLYAWNSQLFVGGTFNQSGATTIAKIAKLSGSSWTAYGAAPGPVNAIVDYNGELYIGGYWFPPYVCKYNGTTVAWDNITGTGGPDNEVTSLAVYKKQTSSNVVLWIGGKFTWASSPHLCTWTSASGFSTSFNTFNSTAGANVNALLTSPNYLYAGGGFSATVLGNSFSKLGKYNGTATWDSVGVTFNNDVNALTGYNGYLVAGGKFTSFGTGTANRIAWRNLAIGIDEIDENSVVRNFFPNPLVDNSVLRIQTKSSIHQPSLQVFDLDGREINPVTELISFYPFNNEVEYKIERSGLPAGIYFYELSDQKTTIATGKFVVE